MTLKGTNFAVGTWQLDDSSEEAAAHATSKRNIIFGGGRGYCVCGKLAQVMARYMG